MITVLGKAGIKVTVLAHSISEAGIPFITYEICYPRLILAELNTHRMLSKNSFSSRAVPFEKMLAQLTGRPVRFGANQGGMQDKGDDYDVPVDIGPAMGLSHSFMATATEAWEAAKQSAAKFSEAFFKAGYHKQVYNRRTEADQMQKTVISGTEWANFFWLRDDDAADPTIRELARCMREATEQSTPVVLRAGEWHLPYMDGVSYVNNADGTRVQQFLMRNAEGGMDFITLNEAVKVSCARCAAVSYRNEGYDLAKSIEVYGRLVGSEKKHASAFEHCATPMFKDADTSANENGVIISGRNTNMPFWPETWAKGVTHVDREGNLWSGNLKQWIQYRKLIPGENYKGA